MKIVKLFYSFDIFIYLVYCIVFMKSPYRNTYYTQHIFSIGENLVSTTQQNHVGSLCADQTTQYTTVLFKLRYTVVRRAVDLVHDNLLPV